MPPIRLLVLLAAVAMPVVAWLSNSGTFGPDNGTVSDRYPTLLVAAGYAFAIWGLIFLLDLAYAAWQATGARAADPVLGHVAPWTATGFLLTAAWMPLFSLGSPDNGLYWLCLAVITGALACLARAALLLSRNASPGARPSAWAWLPVSLHAGWLSLAAFLNLAQVIVAHRLLPTERMLPWSLVLFAGAAGVLLWLNARMRGNLAYVGAALWGLAAVFARQSQSDLPGAGAAGWVALAIAAALVAQTAWLLARGRTPVPA